MSGYCNASGLAALMQATKKEVEASRNPPPPAAKSPKLSTKDSKKKAGARKDLSGEMTTITVGGKKREVTVEQKATLLKKLKEKKLGKGSTPASAVKKDAMSDEEDDVPTAAPEEVSSSRGKRARSPTAAEIEAATAAFCADTSSNPKGGANQGPNYKPTPATNKVWLAPPKPSAPTTTKRGPLENKSALSRAVVRRGGDDSSDADDSERDLLAPIDGDDAWAGLPARSLEKLLHKKLYRGLQKAVPGISKLTSCQAEAWPHLSKPKTDVLIRSETGSGKTLAYALPLMNEILHDCDRRPIDRSAGTLTVVIVPTRELSLQVETTFKLLTTTCQFVVVGSVHGGEDKHKEKSKLRKGLHVLVATPGRLVDHLQTTNAFKYDDLQSLVLDEADRLLDMGFEHSIHTIVGQLRASRRKVLVSATITKAVERLTHFALSDPVRVGKTEDVFEVPKTLTQFYSEVSCKNRLETLVAFLLSEQVVNRKKKIVVFMSTSDSTEFHYFLLSRATNPFAAIRKNKIDTMRREQLASSGTHSAGAAPIPTATADAAGDDEPSAAHSGPRKANKKMAGLANQHLNTLDGTAEDVVNFDAEDSDDSEAEDPEAAKVKKIAEAITKNKGKIPSAGGAAGVKPTTGTPLFESNLFKLHGNMSMVDRASVFHSFKNSDMGILFATDVAARGLDMPQVDWVVHYDPPSDERCYIHRVGRTARIGNLGASMLFLQPHELEYLTMLKSFAATSNSEILNKPTDPILYHLSRMDRGRQDWKQSAGTLHKTLSQVLKTDEHVLRVAVYAYRAFIRAYAAYPRAVKHIFQSQMLHLGHVAHSFAIDQSPAEIEKTMRFSKHVSEEREMGQKQIRVGGREGRGLEGRIQVDNTEQYHSTLLQKQVKKSRDFLGQKLAEGAFVKPSYSEFDEN